MKQDGKELEPRWKGRKNGEVREEKTGSWKKRRLIWAYFFATYLNYLKDRFLFWRGMGFHLFHSKQRGLSLSDGNIVSAYIAVCNPACLSDNSTRNGGIGYIICLVYLRYSFHCYFFAMQFVISKNSCKLSICRRKNMLSLVSGRIITGRNIHSYPYNAFGVWEFTLQSVT